MLYAIAALLIFAAGFAGGFAFLKHRADELAFAVGLKDAVIAGKNEVIDRLKDALAKIEGK